MQTYKYSQKKVPKTIKSQTSKTVEMIYFVYINLYAIIILKRTQCSHNPCKPVPG